MTHFVLYCTTDRVYVRQGHYTSFTYNLNYAKHFSTQWAAEKFLAKMSDPAGFIVKKIVH